MLATGSGSGSGSAARPIGEGEKTYIDVYSIALAKTAHVALGKEAVGEQRQQDEFREREQLIPRQDKTCSPNKTVSLGPATYMLLRTGGNKDLPKVHRNGLIDTHITYTTPSVSTSRLHAVGCSVEAVPYHHRGC